MEPKSPVPGLAPRPLEELVKEFGGPTRVARLAGVDKVNFWRVRKGKVVPQRAKASRIAAVFGLRPEEVAWPRGYTEDAPGVPPRREKLRVDLSGLYEDVRLRDEIEALIEREVQRRVKDMSATAAQMQAVEGK